MRANHYASLMEEESERVCAERDSWKKEAEGFNAERASLKREARQAREERDETKVLLSSARSHVEKLEEDLKKAKLAASEALNKLEISDEEYRRFTEEVAQREEAHREELEAARTISSEAKGKIIDEYRASPQFTAAAGNYFKGQFESFLKGLVVELQNKAPTVNFREFVSLAPVFGFFDRRAEETARRQAGSSSQAEVPPSGSSEPGQQEEVGGGDSAAPGPSGCPPDKDSEGDRPGPSSTPPRN